MTYLIVVVLIQTFFFFKNGVMAVTSYCDNDYCSTPDKYCCGRNECCTYVWTVWYLWFAFLTGVLIALILLWKYYFQKIKSPKESNDRHISSNNTNSQFVYKPLNNFLFTEKKIDENTIQFNFVKNSSIFEDNSNEINKPFLKYKIVNY